MIALIGSVRIVPYAELTPGKFYCSPNYGDPTPFLFLRLSTEKSSDEMAALYLPLGDGDPGFGAVPGEHNFVELPPLAFRVQPLSITGSSTSMAIRPPMLVMSGTDLFLCARTSGFRGYQTVCLTTHSFERLDHNWIAFKQWSLVEDRNDGEFEWLRFGYGKAEFS